MTYAEYAHRGAYPLVATALLAGLFVLVAFRRHSDAEAMRWARRLVYIWLTQNVFLVVSAAWRLRLYIDAYALTRWRIAAGVWMFLVVCGLLWILVRIMVKRPSLWLINANAVTLLLTLYGCSFVSFDGLIADFNVRHCEEIQGRGPAIDTGYLESLGPETLPALVWLAGELGDSPRATAIQDAVARLADELQDDLRNWRGWTMRRRRLHQLHVPQAVP